MNIWRILEIEPTSDIKVIKTAYAQQAKRFHPEERPEEFKKLQAAYKAALDYAKNGGEKNAGLYSDDTEQQENAEQQESHLQPQVEFSFEYHEIPEVKVSAFSYEHLENVFDEEPLNKFWREMEYIIWHPHARQLKKMWQYLLEQPQNRTLLEDKKIREQFIDKLAGENFYWMDIQRSDEYACQYISQYLNSFTENSISEFQKFTVERIKSNGVFTFRDCITARERKIYNSIWNSQESPKRPASEYLSVYFAYASDHEEQLREIHQEAHDVRGAKARFRKLLWKLVIIIFILLRLVPRILRLVRVL